MSDVWIPGRGVSLTAHLEARVRDLEARAEAAELECRRLQGVADRRQASLVETQAVLAAYRAARGTP